jgi:ribonucleotide reductase beta subunit family protein with ferritin-like domain
MAINALICGILFMTLPETNKKAMPDTVKQVDYISRDRGVGLSQ